MKSTILSVILIGASVASAQQPLYSQCGGVGYRGSMNCVAGTTCKVQNMYYSQCLPGGSGPAPAVQSSAASTSSSSASSSSSSASSSSSSASSSSSSTPSSSSASPAPSSAPVSNSTFFGGVNMAGFDFSVSTDGSFSGVGVDPPVAQYSHFAGQGVNIFRVPFAWQLMTPTLGGSIDPAFFTRYDASVQAALNSGPNVHVIVDVHNYARWNGGIIAQGGPTNDQFTSLWSQLATKYATNDRIMFGIMNEPHDIPSIPTWANTVQLAVNAIRAAGAKTQYILMPGSSYSSAQTLPTEAGPSLVKVTDPIGGTSKLLFDVHKYLDSDNSGTNAECVTNNVAVMTTLVNFLKANGNRQALLSETGGGNTASCQTMLNQELAFVKSNSASIVGFTVWAAGSFDTTYVLAVTPNASSDNALWTQAVKPNLP